MLSRFAQVTNAVENNATGTNVAGANATPLDGAANAGLDPSADAVAEPSWISDLFDSGAIGLLLEGGFFIWPILIMAVMALAVIIERWRSL